MPCSRIQRWRAPARPRAPAPRRAGFFEGNLVTLKEAPDRSAAARYPAPAHCQNRFVQRLPRYSDALIRALRTIPNTAPALSNYGLVLAALKRFDEALASHDKALDQPWLCRGAKQPRSRLTRTETLRGRPRELTTRPRCSRPPIPTR
jgi:hypothetical protein